jgi:hypothetical protein
MSPCADPVASRPHFRLFPYRERPCRLRHPRPVNGTVPSLLCLSVLKCCAPYAGGSPGALDQFFPEKQRPSPNPYQARLATAIPHKTASGGMVISARQAFHNVAALQLARPPDRSVPLRSTRGLVRSSLLPIRYLLSSRVCYPADWPIAGTGLAPVRKAALSAAQGFPPSPRVRVGGRVASAHRQPHVGIVQYSKSGGITPTIVCTVPSTRIVFPNGVLRPAEPPLPAARDVQARVQRDPALDVAAGERQLKGRGGTQWRRRSRANEVSFPFFGLIRGRVVDSQNACLATSRLLGFRSMWARALLLALAFAVFFVHSRHQIRTRGGSLNVATERRHPATHGRLS